MKTSINTLHHQDTDWLRELDFYKQELGILTKRLEEVASKNTHQEVTKQVEHFQNKFIVIREVIDTVHHDVNTGEHKLDREAKAHPQHITEKHESAGTNTAMLSRMKDLSQNIADTRYEFNEFLAKVM